MISINFTELNDSIKTFILSVAVGSEIVIDKLIETANAHLDQLESIEIDTPNAQLHFECSVRILTNAYTALSYINLHAADLFSSKSICPLDSDLEAISNRFTAALDRIKKEVPNVR